MLLADHGFDAVWIRPAMPPMRDRRRRPSAARPYRNVLLAISGLPLKRRRQKFVVIAQFENPVATSPIFVVTDADVNCVVGKSKYNLN